MPGPALSPEVGSTGPSSITWFGFVRPVGTDLVNTSTECRRSNALPIVVSPLFDHPAGQNCWNRHFLVLACVQPKRRKSHASAAMVNRIRPTSTRPPNAEGLTVVLISIVALASSDVALKLSW